MDVIEIDDSGLVLRVQPIPDDWTVADGEITSAAGHRPFPGRWYAAPAGAESGDSYDPATGALTKYAPPVEDVRRGKVAETHTEASRRRNVLMGSPPDDSDTALRNFLSLTARATGKVRREAKGRGKPGEAAVLDQLESLTDGLEQIDTARDSIIAEVQASADPASIDIPNHPSWP